MRGGVKEGGDEGGFEAPVHTFAFLLCYMANGRILYIMY